MKRIVLAIYLCFGALAAQAITQGDTIILSEVESTMQQLIEDVLTNKEETVRAQSSTALENLMENVLRQKGAFDYPFDKVRGLSIVQAAEDPKFRIFTWQLYIDKDDYKYRGFIQMKDGRVIKLEDRSGLMRGVEFSSLKPSNWYGALYYNLQPFKHDGEDCYLLFGYDAYSFFAKRKVLDILYFDGNGDPKFGKTVLEMKDGRSQIRQVKRMLLEYSATVSVTLNYDKEQELVIYDHLIYGTPIKGQMPTNVPDGSYCGMQMSKDGTWKYVDKVYKDDPNNTLINATSYEKMVNEEQDVPRKKKRDLLGRKK